MLTFDHFSDCSPLMATLELSLGVVVSIFGDGL